MVNRLQRSLFLVVCVVFGIAPSALAEGEPITRAVPQQVIRDIPSLGEVEQPLTSAEGLLVQQPAPALAQVTGVQLKPTEKGLEVILETTSEFAEVLNSETENSLITDIPNAQLRLPKGGAFRQDNPTPDIASVEVTNLDAKTLRVTVTGKAGVPTAEVSQSPQALILSVVAPPAPAPQPVPPVAPAPAPTPPAESQQPETPASAPQAEEERLELTVRAEEEAGEYNVPDATTATKTDTPLLDIPASIQVVPQQVLEDRDVRTVNEAIETVSGVVDGGDTIFRIFRGFSTTATSQLRNGYRIGDSYSLVPDEPTVAIEQVEVLKGPGSVLFGALEPGGVINTITKKPLREPYYKLGLELGNRGWYQPSIDLSGPLTDDETVLYRFIAAYNGADGYFNGGGKNNTLIAPSITLNLGDKTSLDLFYQYSRYAGDLYGGLYTVALSDGSLAPRGVDVWGNPDLTFDDRQSRQYGFELEHNFNDNLQLRSAFSANNFSVPEQRFAVPIGITDDRFVDFFYLDRSYSTDIYFGQIDLLGKLNTGSISHQLLVGFDFESAFEDFDAFTSRAPLPPLDLRNPTYDVTRPTDLVRDRTFDHLTQSYGAYVQDQIAFSDNWKLLIGGRYDWVSDENEDLVNDADEPVVNDGAFSPRIGLVYQPSDTVSLYASYSRSFLQSGSSPDQIFKPTRGTQYEVGIKTDFLDQKLSATLAAYHLTKTNVTTPDPNPVLTAQGFSVQTGEQRSQGIELDVAGEILPGWNVIASYAYTDAEVTKDNSIPVGNRLNNVPTNQASLWTTYEIQQGDLEGLGFGLGLFYIGEREGDLDNTFTLGSYLRPDAALYYRRDRFRAALNIRNLFNTDYASFSDSTTYIQRGAPFTITGSVSWEF